VHWTNLGPLQLKAGKFLNQFGQLNRWHPHAWPTATAPALQNLFGDHGLSGIGASLVWLMPPVLAHYNELSFELINGDNAQAFSGESFKKPVGILHLTNYYDLSPATYFEFGISAAAGENDPEEDWMTYLQGLDLALVWSPPERSKYRGVESRTELYFSQRDTSAGVRKSFNMLSYLEAKFGIRWAGGVRVDYLEDPHVDVDGSWGGAGFINFWQSEFVRIRFQYSGLNMHGERWRHRAIVQLTFAMGPHKHEKY
jgi:hypothetical protein